jgi:hypothetical protein
MKKALGIIVAIAMFGALAIGASAAYNAELLGQMNTDISELIGEWDFGDVAGNSVSFEMGKPFTLKLSFAEPVGFSGNWVGLSTNVPVADDEAAEAIPISISIKADGATLSQNGISMINRDNSGFLTIDLARQWGGDYDHFGLANLAFSEIEITVTLGEPVGGGEEQSTERTDAADPTKAGVGDVAVASAIALVAAGAVVFTRKRK